MRNGVGMKLQEGNQFEILRTDRGLQAPAVFFHVVARIPFRKSEIQDALAIELADAANARAETVHQPRQLGQRWDLQDAQAMLNTLGPWRCARPSRVSLLGVFLLGPGSLGCHHERISIITVLARVAACGQGNFLIIGLGVDIAEVPRVQAAIERRGQRFLDRVFTPKEIEYCERFKNKFERYAGRFAAKEAAMKALGTGWRRGIRWVDLEVVREQSGRPSISLAGEAAKIAGRLGVKRISVSITHTEAQALAQVIFED